MPRYDAAIIGGGPEGLVAAILIARAGLSVAVLERNAQPGGRAATREFHPGFRASPYADELPAMAPRLYRALDLARHGAVLVPAPMSVCVSGEGATTLYADDARMALTAPSAARDGLFALRRDVARLAGDIEARALDVGPRPLDVGPRPRRFRFPLLGRSSGMRPWPGEDWAPETLDEWLQARLPDAALRLHLTADALAGRAVSPFLAGTALHHFAPGRGRSGTPPGGLGRLGTALAALARKAGAAIHCEERVTAIGMRRGRVAGLALARGEDIEARTVLSTLDYKRTFGELLESGEDAKAALRHTSRFRIAGQRARVLFALDAPPRFAFAQDAPEAALGPIHLADSVRGFNRTYDLWRTGALDTEAAVTLLVPSLSDPRLAPVGKATMTATISGVPSRLFDGAWTNEKRDAVRDIALAAAERVSPGLSSRVIAAQTLLPPDIEAELGATDGDLDGGEMTPDQVFPAPLDGGSATAWESGRTPIRGLYVAGSCAAPAPFLLAAAGERAAYAILTDLGKGRLV